MPPVVSVRVASGVVVVSLVSGRVGSELCLVSVCVARVGSRGFGFCFTWLHFGRDFKNLCKDPEIGHLGALGGPGGPGNPSKRCGASPRTPWKGFPGPRGRPDPQNVRSPSP